MIVTFIIIDDLGYKVPSLSLVEPSHPHPILLIIFVDSFIMVSVIRGGIGAIIRVSLGICSETIHLRFV